MWRIRAFDRNGSEVAVLESATGEVSIGREPDRRLCLPSPSVSRRHAKLVLDGPQPYVADEGSANGVLVNGVRIAGPTAIVPGTRIDIAEFYLEIAMAGPASSVAAPAPMAQSYGGTAGGGGTGLRLVADEGPFSGQRFDLRPGVSSIGRAIDNDLVFDHPSLSRKHARLRHQDTHVEVEDLGSSNGTFVNGRRVEAPTVVRPGDTLRIGELYFRMDGDRPSAMDASPWGAVSAGPPIPTTSPQGGTGKTILLAAVGGLLIIAVVVGVVLFVNARRQSGNAEALALLQAQAAQHLKSGKDRLAARDFAAARREFDQALEAAPDNAEAKELQTKATQEPENEKRLGRLGAKLKIATSRPDFEAASKVLVEIPEESTFHEVASQKFAGALVAFGRDQCKAKHYADCAWAICRAGETAPETQRGALVPVDARALLGDAEKKLARDKTYTPCKKR